MTNWHKMGKYDSYCLLLLIIFCLLAFVPFNSEGKVLGIAFFGWAQGILMFVAPITTIILVKKENKNRG